MWPCITSIFGVLLILSAGNVHGSQQQEWTGDNSSILLDTSSFGNLLEHNNAFVLFYHPNCHKCKQIAPIWAQLARLFNGNSTVKIARVDCSQERQLCDDQRAKSYPSLRFYNLVEFSIIYKSKIHLSDLAFFVNTRLMPEQDRFNTFPKRSLNTHVEGKDHFQQLLASSAWVGVNFCVLYSLECQRMIYSWVMAANHVDRRIRCARVDCNDEMNSEVCASQGVSSFPKIFIYKDGVKVGECEECDFYDPHHIIRCLTNAFFDHEEL